jgi:hypothetical protein
MDKHKILGRRSYLGLALACITVFSACGGPPQVATQAPPSPTASPTQTPVVLQIMSFEPSATSQPTEVSTPTQEQQPAQTSTPAEDLASTQTAPPTVTEESVAVDVQACSTLQNPKPGAQLPAAGWWKFDWDAWPHAAAYQLQITAPNGWVLKVETDETNALRALEALGAGGEYTWTVVALSATGQELCHTQPQSFTKPEKPPSPTPEPARSRRKEPPDPCGCKP